MEKAYRDEPLRCAGCEHIRTKICWGTKPSRVYMCCILDVENDYRDVWLINRCPKIGQLRLLNNES